MPDSSTLEIASRARPNVAEPQPQTPPWRVTIERIIAAYDDPIVRWYARVRFLILRQRFLDEIGQYLPTHGHVVDVGCGFGLFALYFAATHPWLTIEGLDRDARRIALAQRCQRRLGLTNVSFRVGDAHELSLQSSLGEQRCVDCVYMLDIVHHIDPAAVRPLFQTIATALRPSGRLLIKDVDSRPFGKMAFTWALDKLMDLHAPVNYWPAARMTSVLHELGFGCVKHAMVDILPYPHVLYIAGLRSGASVKSEFE